MKKKYIDNYIFCFFMVFPSILFILVPSYPESGFDIYLNNVIDNSVFSDGYYKPSNYPFAAKVVNSFTVVSALVTGVLAGVWCKDVIVRLPKNIWWICLLLLLLGLYVFWKSIYPQEFKITTGRSFGLSESFHNTPVLFMFLMTVKTIMLYSSVRIPISIVLFALKRHRK